MDSLIDLLASGQDLFMNREVGGGRSLLPPVAFGLVQTVSRKSRSKRTLGAGRAAKAENAQIL